MCFASTRAIVALVKKRLDAEHMTQQASEHDIESWLERLRRGDRAAAEAIYRGFYGKVTGFVRLQIADEAAVEEIVDDTFMVLFENPGSFDGRSRFTTWLLGIAKRKSADWWRAHAREPSTGGQDDTDTLDHIEDPAWPALEHLAQAQVATILRSCIGRLPPAQREALYWVFFEALSLVEVAKQLDCAGGTIKSRLFHARLKMADCVKRRLNHGLA